jgi:hypothetical protein
MTTTLRRCCATCSHFRAGASSCTGWCAHPGRVAETDARVFVRERELGCRAGWAVDLWEEKGAGVRVVGLVVWGPFWGEVVPDELPGDLLGWLVRSATGGQGDGGTGE